ncbi:MAG: hypothetical protein A3G25_13885 [Betaproteobacteria bacterium RIFCSPLOWO2_12_FULL_63_13]|nr:MAG: hypothetical protein A3G25_13885 [Betaproteobacteria bacterium RIFCSPLOWO2_12_FULL_63_13]
MAASPVVPDADGISVAVTVSVGITGCHSNADTAESLIARADRMLYRAKEAGSNRVESDI